VSNATFLEMTTSLSRFHILWTLVHYCLDKFVGSFI